ncbi:RNA polymerase sigma factor [Glaciecola sp. 2405UD65-10]|uniref:RNA polymerase sigma factor n=1 Tax=Glaciecola sp. 2405UD65-10 TaxID=3397244 RepID=UPI003B5A3CC3
MEANTLAIEPIQAAKTIQDYSEAELVAAAQAKDKGAFKLLYKAHLNRVYALCFRLCADKSLAEDATQEVFIQVWRKIENFNGDSLFTTWLHSLASNVTISHIRKQRGWWQKMMNIEDAGIEPFSDENTHCSNQLEGLIMRLPERARMVFVLHAIEGYRHNQVASMLNMAEGTSKAQYHRARTLLQEWMDE